MIQGASHVACGIGPPCAGRPTKLPCCRLALNSCAACSTKRKKSKERIRAFFLFRHPYPSPYPPTEILQQSVKLLLALLLVVSFFVGTTGKHLCARQPLLTPNIMHDGSRKNLIMLKQNPTCFLALELVVPRCVVVRRRRGGGGELLLESTRHRARTNAVLTTLLCVTHHVVYTASQEIYYYYYILGTLIISQQSSAK